MIASQLRTERDLSEAVAQRRLSLMQDECAAASWCASQGVLMSQTTLASLSEGRTSLDRVEQEVVHERAQEGNQVLLQRRHRNNSGKIACA